MCLLRDRLVFGGILLFIFFISVEAGWMARGLGREFSHNALGTFPYLNYFQLLNTAYAV